MSFFGTGRGEGFSGTEKVAKALRNASTTDGMMYQEQRGMFVRIHHDGTLPASS